MSDGAPRLDAWFERARTALVGALLSWTVICLGGTPPETRAVTALLAGLLVVVHLLDPARAARAGAAGLLFLAFLLYAAVNAAFLSPVRWLGWTDWLNWAQTFAVFWVVLNGIDSTGCRRFLCALIGVLGVVAAAAAVYQHAVDPGWMALGRRQAAVFAGRSSGTFGIPNSLGAFAALLIPPMGYVVIAPGRPAALRLGAGAALGALAAGFALAVSRGAWISLAGALVFWALLAPGRRPGRRALAALYALAGASAAASLLYLGFPTMRVRADQLARDAGERTRPIMWRGAWEIFEAHPAFGGGAGSYDTLFEAYRPEGYIDEPVYAHCDYLNTLADYGATGFVLLFGAAAVVAGRCARARGVAAAAAAGLLAFGIHVLVDYDLKIPALAMTAAAIAALVVREVWPDSGPQVEGIGVRVGLRIAAGLVLAFTFFWVVPKYRAEASRAAARGAIDALAAAGADVSKERQGLEAIRSGLSRAVELDPLNAQAWSDKAYADSLEALAEPSRMAELGARVSDSADRAVRLSPIVAEFWIRRGVGLDMQRQWVAAGNCFTRALSLAPVRADVWYYQAYHLSLASNEVGPAMAAANLSLRLDPGFGPAQALRLRLADRLQPRP